MQVTMTAKRQATFPRELCDELGIGPGDKLEVDSAVIDGQKVVVLRPRRIDYAWVGRLRVRADLPHDMAAIRKSVGRGLGKVR